MGLEEAEHAVWADEFDPEVASADDVLVSRILTWGETIGTLTKNGLLDTDLVPDWLWVSGMWTRVGSAALKLPRSMACQSCTRTSRRWLPDRAEDRVAGPAAPSRSGAAPVSGARGRGRCLALAKVLGRWGDA